VKESRNSSYSVPSLKASIVCNVDMSSLSTRKCFLVHTLTVDDLNHPTIAGLLRSSMCNDIKLQFCRSTEDDSQLLGSVYFLYTHIVDRAL